MRIPSGKTDQKIYFYAADSTDLVTAETGLSSFTVYRSRNGGAATAYTTPTVAELSSANMPGLYCLTIDEDTTIASGSDSEEYAITITATGMAPVHRVLELYRREVTTGETLTVTTSRASVGFIANDTITAASLNTDAVTEIVNAVWAAVTRTLTAGTNISLAKGTGVTGFTDIDAAGVRTAVGLASANLDTQLNALPTAAENATELLDQAAGVETGLTVRQWLRLGAAVLFGKASGLDTTTAVYRDFGDTKDRISATVDASGNRTGVTRDAS